MGDRDKWRGRVREVRASSMTWYILCWIRFGIRCTQNHHLYLWIFPPTAGTSSKNWPIRDEDWNRWRSFAAVLNASNFLLGRCILGILAPEETRITDTGFWQWQNNWTPNMATSILTISTSSFASLTVISLCKSSRRHQVSAQSWYI